MWNDDISHAPYINLLDKLIFEGLNLQAVNLDEICQVWYHSMQQKIFNRTQTVKTTKQQANSNNL